MNGKLIFIGNEKFLERAQKIYLFKNEVNKTFRD